ncbi:GspE/PulE family protein [Simplicispira lacusdiani]|uniref:GspE/PulE family protein n=1 Tax=Simplicispira lacusdiani TaxID=2213010 RepID=UPI000E751E36|nr:ATPase, T2SS/T4P/T4SS family [Simplicispira lacusdiani]
MERWPLPPFFKDGRAAPDPSRVDAIVFTADGKTLEGWLDGFEPERQTALFVPRDEPGVVPLHFADIKSIQLLPPIPLVPDTELSAQYQAAGGQAVHPGTRPFVVRFVDGEQLHGQTRGFVKTGQGLFIYLETEAALSVRIFIPGGALESHQVGGLLGQQLVQARLVSPATVDQALREQKRRRGEGAQEAWGSTPISAPQELADRLGGIGSFSPVRLGDILINQGLVSREQMFTALGRMQGPQRHRLGHILVEMGALTHEQLTQAVAEQLSIPLVALGGFTIPHDVLALVPKEFAVEHQVLPLVLTDKVLVVAVESPIDTDYLDELRFSAQKQITPVIAPAEELAARITHEYSQAAFDAVDLSIEEELRQLTKRLGQDETAPGHADLHHQVSDNDSLVVRLVNKMIMDAQKMGASDIHIESYPEQQPSLIRLRVDGDLREYLRIPYVLRAPLLSRLKIMASLDISERRMPQDGKIDFSRFAPTRLELRVAVLPTTNGLEDIVMRLLASSKPIPLDKLGMNADLAEHLQGMVRRSYGLILVCGPTGSGKTTTLHSLLAEVNTPENKIWTAEDPIEITHQGLRQIQMVPRIGLTFAAAMRAFLRADPDIIMVGEMRDSETAHIAIEASLTGHLVMSTLHTNSAPESVVRMLDMGLDPFNFADALIGVLSQRLARRLCPGCKKPHAPDGDELEQMAREYCAGTALDPAQVLASWRARFGAKDTGAIVLYQASGCEQCNHGGYKGRVGIYELMAATPAIKKLVQTRAPVDQLFERAAAEGMLRLQQYGMLKVLEGVTDLRSVRGACA